MITVIGATDASKGLAMVVAMRIGIAFAPSIVVGGMHRGNPVINTVSSATTELARHILSSAERIPNVAPGIVRERAFGECANHPRAA